jgi:hypothetical protein
MQKIRMRQLKMQIGANARMQKYCALEKMQKMRELKCQKK